MMMTPRFKSVEIAGGRGFRAAQNTEKGSRKFGRLVFSRTVMERMLRREVCDNAVAALEGREKLNPEYADAIASAMKEWAISLGATHYTHWFQPLTGAAAQKHDSFIDWATPGQMIERFGGEQLLQGEPDASSFPSGGLRSTFEARGYTGWDPTSPAFVWVGGHGVTLCIPSVYFSWTGDVLDNKIPLLRSDKKINEACLRMLRLCGVKVDHVYSTLGWEQEYFIVDRALCNLRPDLVTLGRTVYGAPPPKGQELQDHYFGAVHDRILSYMDDFERRSLELGIPVKTRHNEVAPSQHEVAPIFEKASVAVDHNILLMELMERTAQACDLKCLLDEKPFARLNGSGKHNNWSLSTDTGTNLLSPGSNAEKRIQFVLLLTAILHGVYEHADLLLASIASAGNDNRLGGHEAPPAIVSVYLGKALEDYIEAIEGTGKQKAIAKGEKVDLGIPVVPDLTRDNTDRNRTSPFAFTGNKFEFRAVGSAASCAWPVTVLNTAVASSLNKILDDIDKALDGNRSPSKKVLAEVAMPVIRKYLKASKKIRYSGDNYDAFWHQEANIRKLPKAANAVEATEALLSKKAAKAFKGVLTADELRSRFEIFSENYSMNKNVEINLMIEMFNTQILPAALKCQKEFADSIIQTAAANGGKKPKAQQAQLNKLSKAIDEAIAGVNKMEVLQKKVAKETDFEKRAKGYAEKLWPLALDVREKVDFIETIVDDALWPFPKYRELLFIK